MTARLRHWRPDDEPNLRRSLTSDSALLRQVGLDAVPDADVARHLLGTTLRSDLWSSVLALEVDGVACGNVAVTDISRGHDTGWVSYWLAPEIRGRGLAERAVATLARYALTPQAQGGLGLYRLELGHRTNNPASCAVAGRAGFLVEGLERAKLCYGDERFDVETHARLVTDPVPALDPRPLERDPRASDAHDGSRNLT